MIQFTGKAVRAGSAVVLCAMLFASFPDNGVWAKELNSKKEVVAAQEVSSLLNKDEELAHPIVKGTIGPWKDATVVFANTAKIGADIEGKVIVRKEGGTKTFLLPPRTSDELPLIPNIRAVMFRKIGQRQEPSLIVLHTAEKIRPEHSIYLHLVTVYQWNGTEFIANEDLAMKLDNAKNAAQIDRRLKKIK
jgi:hypothetical protein